MTKELALNTTLSHYRIVSKICAGGMGEGVSGGRDWAASQSRVEDSAA